MGNNVYVLTETVEYTDFETHYETFVLGVFDNFDDVSKIKIAKTLEFINKPKGYKGYDAEDVERHFDINPVEPNKYLSIWEE